ncbi:hypothetical protein Q4E93_17615 [Flavitalea sp. BT771]|uniref:hypothetical protein n=1 Tax=Flavitalea sp. BT771 TaxID=3063329 RepID=UPI0026E37452|nr:hypothetical protein [Flavitalea sp. BT771]MDO6432426.1 hypothetical protein [Flavitalea sp. BT771]MDV6221336.1 hypothetical protein [Flavitalea sp. BT771]
MTTNILHRDYSLHRHIHGGTANISSTFSKAVTTPDIKIQQCVAADEQHSEDERRRHDHWHR